MVKLDTFIRSFQQVVYFVSEPERSKKNTLENTKLAIFGGLSLLDG